MASSKVEVRRGGSQDEKVLRWGEKEEVWVKSRCLEGSVAFGGEG